MHNQIYSTIAKVKTTVIKYPQFNRAYMEIERIIAIKQQENIAINMLCLGAAGTGKSTLKKEIANAYPTKLTTTHPIIPVLIINTPAIPSVKNVAESILITLGDPLADKGSTITKTQRILTYLKLCNVQLIIFDELQHFIDQGQKNTPLKLSDWLKSLVDETNIPTILMGLERSEQIIKVNEQLRRRFNQKIILTPFPLSVQNDYVVFAGVIKKIISLLNIHSSIEVKNMNTLKKIHYATNGIMDYMIKLFLSAYETCILNNSDLSLNALETAFLNDIFLGCSPELNPFSVDFNSQPLNKVGMPFHVYTPA